MTIEEAGEETRRAWTRSYSAQRNAEVLKGIESEGLEYRITHVVARLFFRGIYFPQMGKRAWIKLISQNRLPLFMLLKEGVGRWRASRSRYKGLSTGRARSEEIAR
jgi:hypothetical protein